MKSLQEPYLQKSLLAISPLNSGLLHYLFKFYLMWKTVSWQMKLMD